MPALVGSVLLVVVAVLFNNLAVDRHYPVTWFGFESDTTCSSHSDGDEDADVDNQFLHSLHAPKARTTSATSTEFSTVSGSVDYTDQGYASTEMLAVCRVSCAECRVPSVVCRVSCAECVGCGVRVVCTVCGLACVGCGVGCGLRAA